MKVYLSASVSYEEGHLEIGWDRYSTAYDVVYYWLFCVIGMQRGNDGVPLWCNNEHIICETIIIQMIISSQPRRLLRWLALFFDYKYHHPDHAQDQESELSLP